MSGGTGGDEDDGRHKCGHIRPLLCCEGSPAPSTERGRGRPVDREDRQFRDYGNSVNENQKDD